MKYFYVLISAVFFLSHALSAFADESANTEIIKGKMTSDGFGNNYSFEFQMPTNQDKSWVERFNQWSTVVVAVATIVLATLTCIYVIDMRRYVKLTKQMLDEMKLSGSPWVYVDLDFRSKMVSFPSHQNRNVQCVLN
jgi:hypothetical protein